VDVQNPRDARSQIRDRKEAAREAERQEALDRNKEAFVAVLARYPEGETKAVLKDEAGLNETRFRAALADLLSTRVVEPCKIVKPNRKTPYDAYRLVKG
jgi:hypothetical protein